MMRKELVMMLPLMMIMATVHIKKHININQMLEKHKFSKILQHVFISWAQTSLPIQNILPLQTAPQALALRAIMGEIDFHVFVLGSKLSPVRKDIPT